MRSLLSWPVARQKRRNHKLALRRPPAFLPKTSFAAITGERSQNFPPSSAARKGGIDDPHSLDFTAMFDIDGDAVQPGTDGADTSVTHAVRRTPIRGAA